MLSLYTLRTHYTLQSKAALEKMSTQMQIHEFVRELEAAREAEQV
jgi:hypothetical protein